MLVPNFTRTLWVFLALITLTTQSPFLRKQDSPQPFLLGAAKADITGPTVELNLDGYADTAQKGSGLRQRLYSRAFIVGSTSLTADRFVYLLLDTQSGDTAVRRGILEGIAALGADFAVYTKDNVAVAATHSHSGVGAWHNYFLPQVTNLGFSKESYRAIVKGAVESVRLAHEALQGGYLDIGTATVEHGNIQRSLSSYLANPQSERELYGSDTDTEMQLLRFRRATDLKTLAILTFFPIHPISLFQNNTLLSGDNKGLAANLIERLVFDKSLSPSTISRDDFVEEGFVAGFSQANHADTSPNVEGAWCDDGSGEMCNVVDGTCPVDGTVAKCHGRGPKWAVDSTGVASCFEMAKRQVDGAKKILSEMGRGEVKEIGDGSVKSFHLFHDMRFWNFTLPDGSQGQTCPAAMGNSGTTDGPTTFPITQGDSDSDDNHSGLPGELLQLVSHAALSKPTPEQIACQYPKPILLNVGEFKTPYTWAPNIIDIQVLRAGNFAIIVSPTEVTTMAGRRWKEAVRAAMKAEGWFGDDDVHVAITSPANTYAHYMTTPEEYSIQRYEGASTLFGPHTLPALVNLTLTHLKHLSPSSLSPPSLPAGPSPPDNRDNSLNLVQPVLFDAAPLKKPFGTCIAQPKAIISLGSTVSARFQGANPRNDLRLGKTFAQVEKLVSNKGEEDVWEKYRNDEDWDLVFMWDRTNWVLGHSEVTLEWATRAEGEWADGSGTFRFRYFGDSKGILGSVKEFQGVSEAFQVM